MEVTGSVYLYSDNDEFWNGNRLETDDVYAVQGHLIHTFRPGLWASLSTAYGSGGEAQINGVNKDNPTELAERIQLRSAHQPQAGHQAELAEGPHSEGYRSGPRHGADGIFRDVLKRGQGTLDAGAPVRDHGRSSSGCERVGGYQRRTRPVSTWMKFERG